MSDPATEQELRRAWDELRLAKDRCEQAFSELLTEEDARHEARLAGP